MLEKIGNIQTATGPQKPAKGSFASSPITPNQGFGIELGEKALPAGDISLAVKPPIQSEYITEADIARYKKVQIRWAKSFAKRNGIPVENVLARLPEISIGDAKEMIPNNQIGAFSYEKNDIKLNPIREILNLCGGERPTVVHESTHGYFHNIRRAYARTVPQEQLMQDISDILEQRTLQGETAPILRGFVQDKSTGNWLPKLTSAPAFSAEERKAFVDTLKLLEDGHFAQTDTKELNDAGKKLLREKLLPLLTDFCKFAEGSPQEKERQFKRIIDYVTAFYFRRDYLLGNLTSKELEDLHKNLATPLSKEEKTLAQNSFLSKLLTDEGNCSSQQDAAQNFDRCLKVYFMSDEELKAREEETAFRLEEINQKIKTMKSQGVSPGQNLLQEKQTVEHNQKLLQLTRELSSVELELAGAQLSPEKVSELRQMVKDIAQFHNNYAAFNEIVVSIQSELMNCQTEAEVIDVIKKHVPETLKEQIPLYLEQSKKMPSLLASINKMNSHEMLLADTEENAALKRQFDSLMSQIRDIAPKSDLVGIPKPFYHNLEESAKSAQKASEVFAKWAKRIK